MVGFFTQHTEDDKFWKIFVVTNIYLNIVKYFE